MIAVFIIAALCVAADQITKYLAVQNLYPDKSVDVIDGVLRFTYTENRGAAFGSLSDHRWVFLVFSTLLIIALIGYTVWKHVKKMPMGWLERIAIGLLIGGGIGNMIDRVALGYVIDFIDFCAFPEVWKWIFNGADSFVCIGTPLLMIWILLSDSKRSVKQTNENTESGAENDEAE